MPIRSSAEAISRYVGKYISKHIGNREERDKGVRLAGFSKAARVGTSRFAWATPGSWVWRCKLKTLAESLGVKEIAGMTTKFGPRWPFYVRDVVARFQLQKYPTEENYIADGRYPFREMDGSTDIHCSGVDGGRMNLGQAIGEAIMLLVKPKERIEAAFGRRADAYKFVHHKSGLAGQTHHKPPFCWE